MPRDPWPSGASDALLLTERGRAAGAGSHQTTTHRPHPWAARPPTLPGLWRAAGDPPESSFQHRELRATRSSGPHGRERGTGPAPHSQKRMDSLRLTAWLES